MKIVKLSIAGILVIGLAILSYFIFGSYSTGYRSGRIMKMSKKGFVFKTYEGQLDIGGLESGGEDGAATTVWDFSVKENAVVEDLNSAVDKSCTVKLHYREKYYSFPFWGDTKYFVYQVELVDDGNHQHESSVPGVE